MAFSDRASLFAAGLWWAWRWRDNMIFSDDKWEINAVVRNVMICHDEFISFIPSKLHPDRNRRMLAHWTTPPCGWVKLNIDGSFIKSSSNMGTGGLIRSEKGEWIHGFSSFEGHGEVLLA